jgi:hypothetical protein
LTNLEGQGVKTSDLKISFEVTKDLFGYPNLCRASIYNLSLDTLNKISEEYTRVVLKAGYQNELFLLFKGEIRNIINRREGVDTVTDIYAGDGERATRQATFSRTFEAKTPLRQIVNAIADTFNIPKAKLDGIDSTRANLNGVSYSGRSKDILDKLADDYNFYWSIQDEQFVTQSRDGYDSSNRAIVINRSTGMIGSPSLTELGVDVKVLLNPEINPYRLIKIETPNVDVSLGNLFFRKVTKTLGEGIYRVNKVVHKGGNREADWSSQITARAL